MTGQSEPDRGDLSGKAVQVIGPMCVRLVEELDLDDHQAGLVSNALVDAFSEGVRAGAAEVAATVIEAGVDVHLDMRIEPPDGDPAEHV